MKWQGGRIEEGKGGILVDGGKGGVGGTKMGCCNILGIEWGFLVCEGGMYLSWVRSGRMEATLWKNQWFGDSMLRCRDTHRQSSVNGQMTSRISSEDRIYFILYVFEMDTILYIHSSFPISYSHNLIAVSAIYPSNLIPTDPSLLFIYTSPLPWPTLSTSVYSSSDPPHPSSSIPAPLSSPNCPHHPLPSSPTPQA